MKVIRFLYVSCFFFFLSFSLQAQKGGGTTSPGCQTTWTYSGFSYDDDEFIGTGEAHTTTITPLSGVNGWVNFVVDGARGGNPATTYTLVLTLGTTPYKIIYKAPREVQGSWNGQPIYFQQDGLLEVYVANSAIHSVQLIGTENRAVFRIAREGNVMRFYKNDALIPISLPVTADTGAGARIDVTTNKDGRVHVNLFSPLCQELIPTFATTPIDCTSGVGTFSVSSVQGGTSPYFHYYDNLNFDNIQAISSPRVGWITSVDQDYRASTYYMGIGKTITWQHTGTQLNGNILTSLTSSSSSLPSNTLSSQEEGWIGFRKESVIGWTVGFVDATTSSPFYEFRANNAKLSDIYVGGAYVTTIQALLTDYLRISKEGSNIKFYVNEVEMYSHSLLSSIDLKAKFGFTALGSSISYPTLSFCTPIAPPVITLASTDLSVCQYEDVPVITPTTQNVMELRWYTTNPDGVSPRPIPAYTGASFDPDPTYPSPSLAAGSYTYYVTGVDLNGQETASQAITLTIHGLPTVSINTPSTLCPNSSITLTASNQAPTSSYQWFKDGSPLIGQTTRYLTLNQGGLYKVQVTTAQGCIIETSERNIQPLNFTLNLSYNTSSSGCGRVDVRGTSNINGILYSFEKKTTALTWSSYGSNTYNLSAIVPKTESGIYRIKSTYQGCTIYSNELPVTIYPIPYSTISSPSSVCEGNPVTLNIPNYNASYNYQWQQYIGTSWNNISSSTPNALQVPYVTGTTTATFRVITSNPSTTCSSTSSTLTISYLSSPSITYTTTFIEAEVGETVNFGVTPTTGPSTNYTYQWTGPNNFSSTAITPPIPITSNSYGEYTLVVSNGSCSTTYRAIIAEKGVFATLKENLDASYYHTDREGKLYFKFDEKYGIGATGAISVSTFNFDFQEVNQASLSKEYGYNWYGLDLSSFAIEGDQYVLHIKDELDRRYVLRVKYVTGNNKVIISEDSQLCISTDLDRRSVRLDAKSYVDSSPYSIKWYTSTVSNDITQLETLSEVARENLLFAEETDLDNQLSSTYFETNQYYLNPANTTIYAPGHGLYYVRAVITDYCGNKTYSNNIITVDVYIGTGCRVAVNEITPKKKHRFQVTFSIRRLFSPKPDTNPTVR